MLKLWDRKKLEKLSTYVEAFYSHKYDFYATESLILTFDTSVSTAK